MNEHEARLVLAALAELVRQRSDEIPELTDALRIRVQAETPIVDRAESALSLLAVLAIDPSQDDLDSSLSKLETFVFGANKVRDVVFEDWRTERVISLRDSGVLAEESEKARLREMREFVAEMIPRPSDELRGTGNTRDE